MRKKDYRKGLRKEPDMPYPLRLWRECHFSSFPISFLPFLLLYFHGRLAHRDALAIFIVIQTCKYFVIVVQVTNRVLFMLLHSSGGLLVSRHLVSSETGALRDHTTVIERVAQLSTVWEDT